MTGTAKVKPPQNNAEWARNTQKRLDQVEHPASSRIGQWVLSTEPDTGNLIASFVNGGSIILASPPDPGTSPDDVVEAQPLPSLKLKRVADQGIPANGQVAVQWDTLARSIGEWGTTTLPVETVTVPEDGLYLMFYKFVRCASNDNFSKGFIWINGVPMSSQEVWPSLGYYQSYYLSELLEMNKGDAIDCGAYSNAGGVFGSSRLYPNNITTLTVHCLERM